MIIDNKGKLFGKISIIDILVLLVIVAGIAGVGYKFIKSNTVSPFTKSDTIIMKLYQREDDEYAAKAIQVGDMVTDKSTGAYLGKVTEVTIGPSISFGTDDKGIWVQSEKPGYSSILITVEGTGIYKDGASSQGVYFGSTPFYVNNAVQLFVGNSFFWMDIYSVDKKE